MTCTVFLSLKVRSPKEVAPSAPLPSHLLVMLRSTGGPERAGQNETPRPRNDANQTVQLPRLEAGAVFLFLDEHPAHEPLENSLHASLATQDLGAGADLFGHGLSLVRPIAPWV